VVSSCIYGGTPLTKNKERKKEKYMSSAREVLKNENASVTLLFAFYLALLFLFFLLWLLGASCQKEITIKVRFVYVISMLVGLFLI
jgi:hypothetical protein